MNINTLKRNSNTADLVPVHAKRAAATLPDLPEDILRHIFLSFDFRFKMHSLSLVCKRWRHMVFQTINPKISNRVVKRVSQKVLRKLFQLPFPSLTLTMRNCTSPFFYPVWQQGTFPNLKKLILKEQKICPAFLTFATRLHELDIFDCTLQRDASSLSNLTALQVLSITPTGFQILENAALPLSQLRELTLAPGPENEKVLPESVSTTLKTMTQLRALSIYDVGKGQPVSSFEFVTNLKNLDKLVIPSTYSSSYLSLLTGLSITKLQVLEADLQEVEDITSLQDLSARGLIMSMFREDQKPLTVIPRLTFQGGSLIKCLFFAGKYNFLDSLLAIGFDINERDDGITLLERAIKNKREMEFLLSRKANPNVQNKEGVLLLKVALRARNFVICELLLQYGADLFLIDKEGTSPLDEIKKMALKRFLPSSLMQLIQEKANLPDPLFSPHS